MNYLHDKEFLKQLTENREKTTYVRITALDSQNNPVEMVEGRITQGSINIDGNSAIRRTCSLTMVTDKYDYSNYIWGLHTRFNLEVGLKNNVIDSPYDNIIWFPQGVYIMTSFNLSRSTNNFTIQIQAKDKMCLLNGEVSGTIEATTDFGKIEEEDNNGVWTKTDLLIPDIIKNLVNVYGDEPIQNIMINDLVDYGLELLEYRGDESMFLYKTKGNKNYTGVLLGGENVANISIYQVNSSINPIVSNKYLSDIDDKYFNTTFSNNLLGKTNEYYFKQVGNNTEYDFVKISYGQTAGFRETELTYPGDLIAKAGETVVSVLDKIKNMLGEYEYFYDVNGIFIFQQKKSSTKNLWTSLSFDENNNEVITEALGNNELSYVFNSGDLLTTFNNNTNIANIKNDFSIWGERTGVSGAKIPIHFRYALDEKPTSYTTIDVDYDTDIKQYNEDNNVSLKGTISLKDDAWNAYNQKNKNKRRKQYIYSINEPVYKQNPQSDNSNPAVVYCDWREIIYQMADDYFKYNHILPDFYKRVQDANPELFKDGYTKYEQYYTDIQGFWRQIYYPKPDYDPENKYEEDNYFQNEEFKYWNKDVFQAPETINFWFDFLDTTGELAKINVREIGDRMKVVNDTKINGIYFNETPNIIYEPKGEDKGDLSGYAYFQMGDHEGMFSIAKTKRSAEDRVESLINEHCIGVESATINSVPMYFLQPNTIVEIHDDDTNLHGKYEITKITLPLAYNGTMSLTAKKVVDYIT